MTPFAPLLLLVAALLARIDAVPRIHVDARRGKDATGDGSAELPFQTLAKAIALRAAMEEPWVEIALAVGFHGEASGEALPVLLPAGVRVVGAGSESCELGGREGQPVVVLPKEGRVALESVALRGGAIGIACEPGGRAPLEVELVDVRIEGSATALDLRSAAGPLALQADGLRTRATGVGLHADAGAPLNLALRRCLFAGGEEGLLLDDGRAQADGPARELSLSDCRFEGCANAGFVRRGGDGRERVTLPWRFERCEFRGARFGLALELPGGDVPLQVRDCRFEGNANFGASLVGSGEVREGATRFERCTFRWNGIGAQFLATGRPIEVDGCRFEDSIGIGLMVGNFTGARASLRLRDSLVAANGATGLFVICERPDGLAVAVERCTIADNRGAGVEKKNRKFGTSALALARCVVAGHAADLVKLEPAEFAGCHVGGDPRFRARERRDYRLADDSPARDAEGPLGAPAVPARDGE